MQIEILTVEEKDMLCAALLAATSWFQDRESVRDYLPRIKSLKDKFKGSIHSFDIIIERKVDG